MQDATNPPVIPLHGPLAAMILCGGEGSRMREQGVDTHKPLLEIDGTPSTRFVIEGLQSGGLGFEQTLVVIPPSRAEEYEVALAGLGAMLVVQPIPLGTGDAVLLACEQLQPGIEHVYVTFGSQPLVRSSTVAASLIHHLENALSFTLPTTVREDPYAPLLRDEDGRVVGSDETHLEAAEMPEVGETNIGAYWAARSALDTVLQQVATRLRDVDRGRYHTSSGELGFPNEMVRACLEAGLGVDGIVCAGHEEVIGIKTPESVLEIEEELERRKSST